MKKFLIALSVLISLNSFAGDFVCPEGNSWQRTASEIELYEFYENGTIDAKQGYVSWTTVTAPNCNGDMWTFTNWGEGFFDDKQEAINFWQNKEEKFCVVRDEEGRYDGSYEKLYVFIDGQKYQASGDDAEAGDVFVSRKTEHQIFKAIAEIETRNAQLMALEALGEFEKLTQYPTCK